MDVGKIEVVDPDGPDPSAKSSNYSWYNSIVTFIQFNNVSKRFMPADDGLEDVTFLWSQVNSFCYWSKWRW